MTKDRAPSTTSGTPEPESLDELRGDCARMAGRWTSRSAAATESRKPAEPLHGVRVPDRSSRLLDGMSDYGD
ncbi:MULTISPECIES: hypothetical protein [unclassified Streptomyces]|uniref:hypothetical protein n=1 Tax=unclassified Streptomyces TaxID=2593676 RepID=UPI0022B612D9|nr:MULTISPECIES: hypothetical protein [unclassified Streptomyces]MCZ7413868.1 hypothetical protein [Streptomyces sp. WMMC897]MCZ7430864.1 hypothetical protein [Streptomyces sp. WMMC1477]